MTEDLEVSPGKSIGELGREALWFVGHTAIAILSLIVLLGFMTLFHPASEALSPKLLATVLAFLFPMVIGFVVTKSTNEIGRYVWISGLLFFAVVCVWVLDLPTGNGLCEHCGALEKLWRTFFDFTHGSGLMGGDGPVVGTWIPLALIGYSLGARFSLES